VKLPTVLADVARELRTVSFDGTGWDAILEALQQGFGAAVACRYLPQWVDGRWSCEPMDLAVTPGVNPDTFRRKALPVLADTLDTEAFFDPLLPDARQRDRALLLNEIAPIAGRSAEAMHDYRVALGVANWDQLRVLVCDGARLLSWVGLFAEGQFNEAERAWLQHLVPALRARLGFEQLARHAEHSKASLEVVLEAIPMACILVHASGRVIEANAAARELRGVDADLFARASTLAKEPDARFEIHPVEVRGVTTGYLATLKHTIHARRSQLARRARDWTLTSRQLDVLECIVAGYANKDIASALKIALGTVELHVSAILAKARVESRSALIAAYWHCP
jgi:DNA-binding CsgD family transcriptional regulator